MAIRRPANDGACQAAETIDPATAGGEGTNRPERDCLKVDNQIDWVSPLSLSVGERIWHVKLHVVKLRLSTDDDDRVN